MQAGFDRSNIDISKGNQALDSSSTEVSSSDNSNAITRFFSSLFGEDSDDAQRFSNMGQRSDSMVTVQTISADQAEQAADILDACGATDVDQKSAEYSEMSAGNVNSKSGNQDGDTIQRIEEDLEVGKRSVETGGVRVRSRIVEKPVE